MPAELYRPQFGTNLEKNDVIVLTARVQITSEWISQSVIHNQNQAIAETRQDAYFSTT